MIKTFFLIIFLSFSLSGYASKKSYANEDFSKNVIFLEAGGNGLFVSANYERFLTQKIGLRIGVGSLAVIGLSVPIMINYYVGNKNNKLELGGGIIYGGYINNEKLFGSKNSTLLGITVGLRNQKPKGGIVVRVSFTPFFNIEADRFIPYAGISLGYSF